MKTSVIIPCYNSEKWIGDSLQSVADQTLAPHEIIVIDDGSSDDSVNAIKNSGVDVKLIQTNRANGAGARNAGIEIASGDWIAFQDADDLWLPDHLERASRYLGANDVGYLGHRVNFYDGNASEREYDPLGWGIEEPTSGLRHLEFFKMFASKLMFTTPSVLVQRERLNAVGRFDANLPRRHDVDMWMRVITDHTWTLDPTPTVAVRIDTPGSISRSIANATYYYFKAMKKNSDVYAIPAMENLLTQLARNAISTSFTFGTAEDQRQAIEIAWADLALSDRPALWVGRLFPKLFSTIHRYRNRQVPAFQRLNQSGKQSTETPSAT